MMVIENQIVKLAIAKGKTFAMAESCTGGMVAQRITAVPGASQCFVGGVVSYANSAKIKILKVPALVIRNKGAVSEASAAQMAEGARKLFDVDTAVAITGIAGPDGGTPDKPVGMICFGVANCQTTHTETICFKESTREAVRQCAAEYALKLLLQDIQDTL